MQTSPWIKQLKREIQFKSLEENTSTDAAIIGAGISGIATAYYILQNTDLNIILLDAFKIAHGATGHNAGQITTYFEKPFHEIVEEHGLNLAIDAQKAILSAWDLLDDICITANLKTPLSKFIGYAGCSTLDQLLIRLKNKDLRESVGLDLENIYVARNAPFLNDIPKQYAKYYTLIDQKRVLELLETENTDFYVALATKKGTMNSALFCEELLGYLIDKYNERIRVFEHTPINTLELHKNCAILESDRKFVRAKKVILCTNGFGNIEIINHIGQDIDAKFHENIKGLVGYMGAYLEPVEHDPIAISYFGKDERGHKDPYTADPYFYLTRRKYEVEENVHHNLVSIGGPELQLNDKVIYDKNHTYEQKESDLIEAFLVKNSKHYKKDQKLDFKWHGLMGFTKNGLRLIGPEPRNTALLYNLGCNGVGIMPAIYGGYKISQFLLNKVKKPSIFDPQ